MKLLTAEQIKQWDAYTIAHEPISSVDLMERAALKCTEWIISKPFFDQPVKIFCGKGNNGGDGLAIARQLIERAIHPTVYILEFGHKGSDDFQANLQRLHRLTKDIHFLHTNTAFPPIHSDDIVIDALFGSGLNRALDGLSAALVGHINNSQATVISIDLPSGMFPDKSSKGNQAIKADHTLTFQVPKLCLLSAENSEFFGEVEVLDISLHAPFLSTVTSDLNLTGITDAASLYQPRNAFSHKGHFGHALIIGGAEGKAGAAIIAAELCLRTGCGLTSVHLLSGDYAAINTRCPEAMTLAGDELVKKNLGRFSAVGVGPGLGTDDIAQHIVSLLIDSYEGRMVLDADALNILAQNAELLNQLPAETILTPHSKEFDRLFGEHQNDFERIDTALRRSEQMNCIIVLKGHYTLVACNGEGWFNTTGNPGLAKGGSGDALTGMITSLLAQDYPPGPAVKLGVFLHGLAADMAVQQQSFESLLATDLSDYVGLAFKKLSNVS
jgi:ADP-dependent NAD(P)H-hydrate dehydratase / NAD(P)H-hydrate epimerase